MTKDIHTCIQQFLAYISAVHVAHWQADTLTSRHVILGNLYDGLTDKIDLFTEVYMGKYEVIVYRKGIEQPDLGNRPVAAGLDLVKQLASYFDEDNDDDLMNIIADMRIELNQTKYLLKEK